MHRAEPCKAPTVSKKYHHIDESNARPLHIVIAEKDELIRNQKMEIEKISAKRAGFFEMDT